MKHFRLHRGFTLVEIMVVAALMVMLMGPILMIFRAGSKTALRGMLQVQTTIDARRIIRQIHTDLKLACFPTTDGHLDNVGFENILKESGTAPEFTYSFLSFPIHSEIKDAVPVTTSGVSPRRASKISYKLEKLNDPGKPYMKLTRIEEYHPDLPRTERIESHVLSERVNFLEIKPVELQQTGQNQFYFWITLQLVDTVNQNSGYQPYEKLPTLDKPKDLQIADFFDVVYPEFFHAFWNQYGVNRNWHVPIGGP